MMDHPFAKHEVEYFSNFDFVGNHKTVVSVGQRNDLPNRITYHFKSNKVVAYMEESYEARITRNWAFPPFVDRTMPGRTEMMWTL